MNKYKHLFNAPQTAWRPMIVEALADIFQAALPEHFLAFYLIGSSIEATTTPISDIDGVVFLQNGAPKTAVLQANELINALRWVSPLRLDVIAMQLDDPRWLGDPRVKLNGHLVVGADVVEQLPMPTKEAYLAWIRPWPINFLAKILHDGQTTRPLVYPEPNDEFYGYTRLRANVWYPAGVSAGTKELVAAVGWAAAAIVAQETGAFVTSRSQAIAFYQANIGDHWADYIQEVYDRCGQQWAYAIPNGTRERLQLRAICRQFRDFANFYLKTYADG